jgi:hypothetical protein
MIVTSAGMAVYGQSKAGRYTNSGSGSIVQPKVPQPVSTDATYDAGPYPKFRPVLTPGDGRQEVLAYCDTCHSPNFITMQPPLPADTWAAEVAKMTKTFGAQIPDDTTQKIIRYLQANYTPETRKH